MTIVLAEQKESKEVGKNDPPVNGKELLLLPAGTQIGLKEECLEVEKEKVELNSSEGVKKKEAGLPEGTHVDGKHFLFIFQYNLPLVLHDYWFGCLQRLTTFTASPTICKQCVGSFMSHRIYVV